MKGVGNWWSVDKEGFEFREKYSADVNNEKDKSRYGE